MSELVVKYQFVLELYYKPKEFVAINKLLAEMGASIGKKGDVGDITMTITKLEADDPDLDEKTLEGVREIIQQEINKSTAKMDTVSIIVKKGRQIND